MSGAPAQRRCASCWAKKTAPALGPMGPMGPMPEANVRWAKLFQNWGDEHG
jgi:hypothetical protein